MCVSTSKEDTATAAKENIYKACQPSKNETGALATHKIKIVSLAAIEKIRQEPHGQENKNTKHVIHQ